MGGLLIENGWTETTKLGIILGSIAVLLMVDMERLISKTLWGTSLGTFFQTVRIYPFKSNGGIRGFV